MCSYGSTAFCGAFLFKEQSLIYITTATTTVLPACAGFRLEINATLTGTITILDGSKTVAVITNPGIVSKQYWGFSNAPSIVTSAVCDITTSIMQNTP